MFRYTFIFVVFLLLLGFTALTVNGEQTMFDWTKNKAQQAAQSAVETKDAVANSAQRTKLQAQEAKDSVLGGTDYVAQAKEALNSAGETAGEYAQAAKDRLNEALSDSNVRAAEAKAEHGSRTLFEAAKDMLTGNAHPSASYNAGKATQGTKDTLNSVGETLSEKAQQAKETLAEYAQGAKEAVLGADTNIGSPISNKAAYNAGQTVQAGKDSASAAGDVIRDQTQQARDRAQEMGQQARDTAGQYAQAASDRAEEAKEQAQTTGTWIKNKVKEALN